MENCPYCAEEILDKTIVCGYCGRDLQESTLDVKKAKLRMILVKELGTIQRALIERLDFLDSESDKMKRAEDIDRTSVGVLKPLPFLGEKKHKEENREEWIDTVSKADSTSYMLRIQLYVIQGILEALDKDRLSVRDIDEFINKYSK